MLQLVTVFCIWFIIWTEFKYMYLYIIIDICSIRGQRKLTKKQTLVLKYLPIYLKANDDQLHVLC